MLSYPDLSVHKAAPPTNNVSPNPDIKISTDPITYGLALENVFAFKESHLQFTPFRRDPAGRTIAKDFQYAIRAEQRLSRCNPRFTQNKSYNSWAVRTKYPRDGYLLNPYEVEPLYIVEAVLREGVPDLAEETGARRTSNAESMAGMPMISRPAQRNLRIWNTLLPGEKEKLS